MTTYEFWSIIVAVAALAFSVLVPLFQFLFAKFQRPKKGWGYGQFPGQRKLLVASNAATRLCAITRTVAADWRRIDEVALQLIDDAVGSAGLDVGRYFELAGEARLTKTHGRRALGCMNDLSSMLGLDSIDMDEKLQWREMELFNCRLISKCVGHEGYGIPAERFAEDLRALLERSGGMY